MRCDSFKGLKKENEVGLQSSYTAYFKRRSAVCMTGKGWRRGNRREEKRRVHGKKEKNRIRKKNKSFIALFYSETCV